MTDRTCLPNRCTVMQLHQWLIEAEASIPKILEPFQVKAEELIGHFQELPPIQQSRHDWKNHRPFPNDNQLLLLAMLFSPSQDFTQLDEEAVYSMIVALSVMALPDPFPKALWVDIAKRQFWADERLQMVKAAS